MLRRRSLEDANGYADDQVDEANNYADEEEADDAVKDAEDDAAEDDAAEDDAAEDGEYTDDANYNNYGQDNWWEEEIAANTDDDYDAASDRWSQVSASFHQAEDRAWQYYDSPPSQWTAAQWDLVCGLVGGLLVLCCGISACCAYWCITQADPLDYPDAMSPMSIGSVGSMDGQSMGQRTRQFWADKRRRLGTRNDDYSAYKDGSSYFPPSTPSDPVLAKLDYATVRRKDEEAQERAERRLKDERKKADKLLQARQKHNYVGYYVS